MTPLAAHADQAVRHAVDAYIDGRSLPNFEGEAGFETRNSRYRLLDGVLIDAPDATLVGAELVGWLIEYPSRSEVTSTWRSGARAILVDTRNDGVRGPHIVVTSATRSFRSDRPGSAPRLPSPVPQNPGSQWTQGGSAMDQAWGHHPAPLAPPAPISPSWGYYPVAAPAPARTLPPPPLVPAFGPALAAMSAHHEAPPIMSDDRRRSSRLSQGGATRAPLPPALESSSFVPPYDARQSLPREGRQVSSRTASETRSRAHQRGLPLR